MCVMCAKSLQSWPTLGPARLLCPWGFSRQEYWSGSPCPPPGDLTDPGIEPLSLESPALTGRFFTTSHLIKLLQGLNEIEKKKKSCRNAIRDREGGTVSRIKTVF